MAIAIDGSSPARKTGTPADNTNLTSAAFTPPANSVLVICISTDTNDNLSVTVSCSVTNGSAPVQRVSQNGNTGSGTGGYAGIWTSVITTSTSMTVSVQRNANGSTNRISFKVYVVTGADTTTPNGATQNGTSTTNNLTSTAYTSTVNNSRGFGAGTCWNALGSPTSTDTGDAEHDAGAISLISVYKVADTTPSGSSVSCNFDASGSSAAIWHWATLEIRPTPVTADGGGASIGFLKTRVMQFGPLGRFQLPSFGSTTTAQSLTLSVSDSLALSDSVIKAVSKPISDSITLTDTAAKLVGKVLIDSITLTDAVAKLVGKVLSDSITLSDSKTLSVGKVISDAIALTDSLAKAVSKALSDSIAVVDSKALLTGKMLSDAVALSDLTAFLTGKALSDSITLTDTRALMLSKVFSDSITMGDTATAVLVLLLQVSDSFSLTDSAAMVLATACKQLLGCGDNPYSFDSSTASSSGACGKSIAGCPTNEYSFNE